MRWVRIAATLVTCAVVVGVGAVPAAAASDQGRDRDFDARYLALGDSVPFGFNPLVDPHNPANFVGYPEALAARLDLNVTNASCPGEASGGFISLTGTDNVCRPFRFGVPGVPGFPLHVAYSTSQLDFAVAFLRAHPGTRLVTLTIGANDLFVLEKQCAGQPSPTGCLIAGLPTLLSTLRANLGTIYGRLRGEAHYRHRIVALTYYVTNFNDPVGVPVIQSLNATVAAATLAARGQVADGFDAFKDVARFSGGDSCKAGLLIVTNPSPLTCDIHPSPRGRDLLAGAIVDVLRHGDRDDDE
jgi:lysophospholipase L1-like esterase